jgi:hypothetical protein
MAVKGLKVNSLNMSDDVPGLVLLNTTSFSGVASQLFDLTGSFQNYRVIISHTGSSVDSNATLRLSLNGTPSTASIYTFGVLGLSNAGAGANISGTQTSYFYATNESAPSSEFAGFVFDLIDVNVARTTKITSSGTNVSSPGAVTTFIGACLHDVLTAYNQVQFLPSTGTFSGRASIYGYNL